MAMRSIRFLRAAPVAVLLLLGTLPAAAVRLDLESVLERAEGDNLTVLIEQLRAEKETELARAARASLFPLVDLEIGQSRIRQANVGPFESFGPPGAFNPEAFLFNQFEAKLVARWDLFSFNTIAEARLANFARDIARIRTREVDEDILQAAATAFYDYLRAKARLATIDTNIERDRVLLDLATERADAGVATRLDVTRAQVRLADDQRARLSQEVAVYEAELRLKTLLLLDLDAELETPGLAVATLAHRRLEAASLEEILERNPDYVVAQETLERNRYARKAARWQQLPELSIVGEWGYAGNEAFDDEYTEAWLVGVTLSMPIFDGDRIGSDVRRATLAIREQEAVLADVRQNVAADYRLALREVQSRFRQIALAEQTRQLREEELGLARVRFERGVADNRDLVEAQSDLAEAEDLVIDALYRYNLARVDLARARGEVSLLVE